MKEVSAPVAVCELQAKEQEGGVGEATKVARFELTKEDVDRFVGDLKEIHEKLASLA